MATHPYLGLRPFQYDEADIFHGRNEEVRKLQEKLQNNHFVAVLGDSGCGKSSLVHVGLVFKLHLGMFNGAHWSIAELRPSNTPFKNLAESLRNNSHLGIHSQNLESLLLASNDSLLNLLKESPLPDNYNLLVIVDQFEELFRYSQQPGEVELFIQWLLASAEHEKVFIVITMRSEFLDKCAQYYELATKINNGLYLVPPLSQDQLREVIAYPIRIFEGEVEESLVNRVIRDVQDKRQDQLPLIQHTLMSMCPQSNQKLKGHKLLLADYEKIGGISGSISNTAHSIFVEFDESQQKIVEILFRNLTTFDKELNAFIRNPLKLSSLAELIGVTWQAVAPVVDEFRAKRHRFLTPLLEQQDRLQADTRIDIGHESLIREWQQLQDWAQQEFELVDFYRKLVSAAQEHQNGKSELWLGANLETALEWQENLRKVYATDEQIHAWAELHGGNFEFAKQFLQKSQQEKQRLEEQELEARKSQKERDAELKNARRLATVIGITAILITLFAGNAYFEKRKAITARREAEQTEMNRTRDLFHSQRVHAALLVRNDDFRAAKQLLEQTRQLDKKLSHVSAPRHARNLLQSFATLMGGESLQDYNASNGLQTIAVSPTGDKFIVVGENGFAAIFDTTRKESVQRLESHTQSH
jgi:hypothetical protein